MNNLKAEMQRHGINICDLQSILRCSDQTIRNKLSGKSTFSVDEALKVRNSLFPGLRIEYLFDDGPISNQAG